MSTKGQHFQAKSKLEVTKKVEVSSRPQNKTLQAKSNLEDTKKVEVLSSPKKITFQAKPKLEETKKTEVSTNPEVQTVPVKPILHVEVPKVVEFPSNLILDDTYHASSTPSDTRRRRLLVEYDVSNSSQFSVYADQSLHNAEILLVRRIRETFVLDGSAGDGDAYDVFNSKGDRVFYIVQSKCGGKYAFGKHVSKVLRVLAHDSREILRFEEDSSANIFSVYKGLDAMGYIYKTKASCQQRFSTFILQDMNDLTFLTIKRAGSDERKTCLCKGDRDPCLVYYRILIPGEISVGRLARVVKLMEYVPPELEGCYGVELSSPMSYNQKCLLLASLFLIYPL